ncbi:hypothetical protein BIV57_13255 [Mangrovactinospora gilvigrisea]|uniref:GS catalytic domain-containing protein n=1 Tax=Mangrovactinospora gilvigrisea TaxID=1428644 RepID=A0A1J7BE49_9ACTN|nr:glutamine synthetase family protein [Mangrovactinospora gilvigrisea]OIV36955.1 hypothetical protein BIV57_13255 [Mangrovactinospora gilvigrisea]
MAESPRARYGGTFVEDLDALISNERIDTVLLAVPDVFGRLKGKLFDATDFAAHEFTGTAEACAYLLSTDLDMAPGHDVAFASWSTGYGDMVLRADREAVTALSWMPHTALVFADPVRADGSLLEVAPRQILREQLALLAAEHGLIPSVGLEIEFTCYRGTYEQNAEHGFGHLVPAARHNLDYSLDHPPEISAFVRRLRRHLGDTGLPWESLKTEAALGQVEVALRHGDAVAACDALLLLKHAVRTLGPQLGLSPTFMAAPQTGVGSGLHLHLSLTRHGQPDHPVLADTDGELSDQALQAITGLLEILPETGPLWAPTPNSYKRLVPDSFAPTAASWGMDNRTCAIRIAGHGPNRHLEIRTAGADANPYLALAAVLAGIRYGLMGPAKPPPPVQGNAYTDAALAPLPGSLAEALARMRQETTPRDLLGRHVIGHLVQVAQTELDALTGQVSDVERLRYFDRI